MKYDLSLSLEELYTLIEALKSRIGEASRLIGAGCDKEYWIKEHDILADICVRALNLSRGTNNN